LASQHLLSAPAARAQTPSPALEAAGPGLAAAQARPTTRPMTREDLESFVDGIMSQRLERDNIAGAAIAVVKDGAVLFEKGYGYADVEKRIPVQAERTQFGIASISKTFTAKAVMQLVERGHLPLN
jgi:CubicO group peptidase (beta-lactamase class C family)